MIVGVPRRRLPGERRVALTPSVLAPLAKADIKVHVEAGAGVEAGYPDAQFEKAGAVIVKDRAKVFADADVIAQVNTYAANPEAGSADLAHLREGLVLIGSADPLGSTKRVQEIAATKVAAFGLELMPRITRAQSMDILSSMATVAGYKAVLLAATRLPRFFPMFMTAAGTIQAAKAFVIGAGVAGLQAIATSSAWAPRCAPMTSGPWSKTRSRASAAPSWSSSSRPRTPRTRAAMPRPRTRRSTRSSASSWPRR